MREQNLVRSDSSFSFCQSELIIKIKSFRFSSLRSCRKIEFLFISCSWPGSQLRRWCRWQPPGRQLFYNYNIIPEIIFRQPIRFANISGSANSLNHIALCQFTQHFLKVLFLIFVWQWFIGYGCI